MKNILLLIMLGAAAPALAATPQDILQSHAAEAKQEDASFKEFSASRGERFYHAKSAKGNSCATCHTDSPKAEGKHERTGKAIAPLAPIANRERLTDPAKVEKWFKRNCQDVLERACTRQEKGDFLAYLLSVK
jgi:mono/diheme cytochrome c family protein